MELGSFPSVHIIRRRRNRGGKPKVDHFVIGKQLDKASPKLLGACLTAKHIKEIVLTQRRAGAGKPNFLTITLKDVFISSLNDIDTGVAPKPTEMVFFRKVIYEYAPKPTADRYPRHAEWSKATRV